ncbi:MAG: glycosyltransferase family 2 protein [Anaerolineae bacterium]|nr:glycosyltransferase family 2 protein [Anaerolineae bacterium]
MSEQPLFSVVIPHWNGLQFLPTCYEALRRQTYPRVEVILADNGSTDGSQEYTREHYPEVRIVQLDRNYGFTGACNAGFRAAQGAYVALLNNDTEADPQWIESLVSAFQRHPDAGFLASKMLLFDKRDHFHTAGDFFGVNGWPGNRGAWQKDEGQFDREEYVFSACAGASVYRKTLLDQVGLLDDDFFFGMEDIDLAWRAQFVGWKCVYVPQAVVYHKVSATGGGVTSSYYDGRNAFYVLIKDYPAPLFRKYWRRILGKYAGTAWEAIRAWRGKAARARLRGMATGLLHIPKMLGRRRQIQSSRKVSLDYVETILKQ